MPEVVPDPFVCSLCHTLWPSTQRCLERSGLFVGLCCADCCGCELHDTANMPGHVVWTPEDGWRGLNQP